MSLDSLKGKFPEQFGTSPDDFLQRYESLIYKIIFERTRGDRRSEAEDLFNDFFLHLAEDNFRRLRSFRGESRPTTFLGRILRNFLYDQYRKKRIEVSLDSLPNEMEETRISADGFAPHLASPEDFFDDRLIQEALKETFLRLSNREKLIFDLLADGEMTAQEISELLGLKVKAVYKNSEKIKKRLKKELRKRGIIDF